MIHADAGWPHARDEREPMCGRTGEASSALTLLPVCGARSWGEEGEQGVWIGMPMSGTRLLCFQSCQK